jgi:hypothetical protein
LVGNSGVYHLGPAPLWHSLGLDLTVSKGVENPGHLGGFIPNEPLHPTVFSVEERVVLARKKFDGFRQFAGSSPN